MLQATVLGPAPTPGQLLYQRRDPGPSREPFNEFPSLFPHHHSQHSEADKPLGRTLQPIEGSTSSSVDDYKEEELVWYERTAIWSRGSQVFRKYTYELEKEDVSKAVFAWFKAGDGSSSSSNNAKGKQAIKSSSETFGPFHTSQHEHWGTPKLSSSSSSNSPKLERTLVVFLQTRAHVYYSSGEDVVVHLPFPIDGAWSISTGGLIIQRALEKRELRKLGKEKKGSRSVLKGMMDQSSMTILDDLMDLEDDTAPSLPRLYTLDNPFDEMKMIVEGRVEDGFNTDTGRLISSTYPTKSSSSILYTSPDPYLFVITYNCESNEIIFYRKTHIPDHADLPPPPPNPRTMRPEEILGPPEPPISAPQPTRAGRPSLNRNPSSFGPSAERRISSISDPLDRTQRRAPRMSRGLAIAQEHPVPTDELQATLDPTPVVPPPTTTKRRSRGLSILSTTTSAQDPNRRTSGASSSFVLHDLHDKNDRMGLQAIAEMDLRETTMLMGLERDEVGSRSDLILDRVWSWKAPYAIGPEDVSVFLSDNLSTSSVTINLHISQPDHIPHLYSFHAQFRPTPYKHFAITPSPPIECLTAIPIISTRPDVFDTLLLSRNGSLSVMTSGGRHIAFQVPRRAREGHEEVARKLASSLRMGVDNKHTRANSERRIVNLSDPIGSRFTIVYEDGDVLRVDADLRVKHKLTRQCLEALSYALPAQQFFFVKREILTALQRIPIVLRSEGKEVWKVFSTTLRAMLQIEGDSQPTTPFDTLITDGQKSPDAIVKRLAQRADKRNTALRTLPTSNLIYGETLRLEDTAPMMMALHLVAQDLRLSSTARKELGEVVRLISDLASKMGRSDWKDYWARIIPHEVSDLNPTEGLIYDTSILDRFDAPPDIITYLHQQLSTRTKPFPSPATLLANPASSELGHVNPCRQTTLVTSLYSHFASQTSFSKRAASLIELMVNLGLGQEWLSDLPYGVALPLLETIRFCQYNPSKHWDAKMYEIIGRWDLGIRAMGGKGAAGRDESSIDLGPEKLPTVKELVASSDDDQKKPLQPAMPHVRFGSDRRVQEVERIMQTTRVRTIASQDPKGASEADVARYHQTIVNTIANRTLSIPVGQGMFEFGTRSTNITDVWDIPLIELSVKVGPGKPTLKAEIGSESAEWPCFHNGVSAGLAISPECKGIDSSWIVFNRPNILNAEHGGFLLGVGLTGHLRSLMTYHAFPLLEPRHDFTSVGLLLGLACSYAGSEDLLITKVLSLHTHALLPLGSMELNASPIIQSSALVGLGLVYAGSRNLRMAEVALSEVGRKEMPNVDGFAEYQESYSFSAAMAFGLIMLGRGGKFTSEVERRMLVQLRRCILGDSSGAEGSKSNNTNSTIDNNLTSPGATLALGLMYLKTGRRDIADMISIPQTSFELDQVRPDLLLLRTFARSLILWDEITPTMGWIEDQLPSFIKSANKGNKRMGSHTMELSTELAYLNIVSGACLGIGMKFAGTATELAHTNLMTFFGILSKASTGSSMTYEGRIRRTAARQGLNIVTLALAMVMSGTGELSVLRRLRVSHGQEGAGVTYGSHMAMHMALGMLFLGRGHYTLGNSNLSIAVMSIAFFPRFLSSPGDNRSYPQAFRHLWALAVEPRCLTAKDVDSGETVYLPVKLKVKEQVPPTQRSQDGTTTGEKGMVKIRQQSLISPTLISPFENILSIEIDSPRYWPVKYDLSSTGGSRDKAGLIGSRTIYVKRKLGFLDYNSDPKGNRSLFVRAGSMTGIDLHYDLVSPQVASASASTGVLDSREVEGLVRVHSGDAGLVGLARLFGQTDSGTIDSEDGKDRINGLDNFIEIVILECLSLDKPRLIPVYLNMYMNLKSGQGIGMGIEELNQLGLIRYFYNEIYDKTFNSSTSSTSNEKRFPLIRANFVTSLIRHLSSSTLYQDQDQDSIVSYLRGEKVDWTEGLVRYLWKNHVPPVQLLEMLRSKVRQSAVEREVLVLKVRDVSEGYRRRVVGGYAEEGGAGGGGEGGQGEGWKMNSVRESIRLWTE